MSTVVTQRSPAVTSTRRLVVAASALVKLTGLHRTLDLFVPVLVVAALGSAVLGVVDARRRAAEAVSSEI